MVLWYNLLVKVFRNLYEAINSLERGKVLVSKDDYLFNPRLVFYLEDIFGDSGLDKYEANLDLGYSVLGRYISKFGIEHSKDEGAEVYYKFGRLSYESIILRSDDLLGVLEKLDDGAEDLKKALNKELIDFIDTSVKILSGLSSSFDLLVFSSFKEEYEDEDNLLISGIYEAKNTPDFSAFWENLLFGNPGAYEKLLSVFDEGFKKYVLSSITFEKNTSKSFGLPFGRFSGENKFLFFDKEDLRKGVGLVSIDRRISSSMDISEWFTRFIVNVKRPPFPDIIGCLDLYYHSGIKEENVVLVPVELNVGGRKILVLHTFLVGDLLDNYKFYVDDRDESAMYSDYVLKIYPNRDGDGGERDGGRFILNASEYVGLEIDGFEGVNLSAVASFPITSFGELVEVGGNKELVPRGSTPSYYSLSTTVYGFSMRLDEKFDLSASSPNEGEPLLLVRRNVGGGYVLEGNMWKNKRFVKVIRDGIKKFESKFLSNLSSSCFLSNDGEKPLVFRDKRFLLKAIELIFRESFGGIKRELDECVKTGRGCFFRVYIDVDEDKYGKNTIIITGIDYSPRFDVKEPTLQKYKDYLKEIFEERALYSKLVDSFGERVSKLCFEPDRGNKVEIDIGLAINENKVKDLIKRKAYLGFINWSLMDRGEVSEDQAEIYSVFLDLVPHDPNSVRFLHSKGIYDKMSSKLKKVIHNLEEALDKGNIQFEVDLRLGIKIKGKENRICIFPAKESSFIAELTLSDHFTYKQEKILLDIVVSENKW